MLKFARFATVIQGFEKQTSGDCCQTGRGTAGQLAGAIERQSAQNRPAIERLFVVRQILLGLSDPSTHILAHPPSDTAQNDIGEQKIGGRLGFRLLRWLLLGLESFVSHQVTELFLAAEIDRDDV